MREELTAELPICESCSRFIGPAEKFYHSADMDFCAACAPTWVQEIGHCRDAAKDAREHDDEEWAQHWDERADEIAADIASGSKVGSAKAIWSSGEPETMQ